MVVAILVNNSGGEEDVNYRDGRRNLIHSLPLKLLNVCGLRGSSKPSRVISTFKQPCPAAVSQRRHYDSDSMDTVIFCCTSLNDLRSKQKGRLTSL
jgi:hypothetical protein